MLDDGHRTAPAVALARSPAQHSIEAEQRTRVDCKNRTAQSGVPGWSIAKLEGKARNPLPKTGAPGSTWSMMRAARSVIRRPSQLGQKPRPCRRTRPNDRCRSLYTETGANLRASTPQRANRQKLTLHEQGGAALVPTSVELPDEASCRRWSRTTWWSTPCSGW